MTDATMAFRHHHGESFPLLSVERRTRDALSSYCAHRWPVGRRKAVAREWSLSDDEARSVCSGRASWQTFDKIIHHKRGGWAVLFPLFGALLDETAEHHIIKMRKAHAEHAQRLGALLGDPWLVPDRRHHDPDSLDRSEGDGRESRRRRVGER